MSAGVALVEARADRGLNEVRKAAQDAVVVEAGDGGEPLLDLAPDRGLGRGAVPLEVGVEAGTEQRHDLAGQSRMPGEGRGEVILAVADAELAQVAAEGADQRSLAPVEPGVEHETVVAVGLRLASADRQHRGFERSLGRR